MLPKISFALIAAIFVFMSNVNQSYGGATEEQMWATAALMREVCLPKYPKVTTEMANDIRAGKIPDNKDVKCYINCVMEMMQAMKKGKLLLESTLKQVELIMPDSYKDEYRAGVHKCKDAAVGIKNNCDAAYAVLVCFKTNIQKFIFP